MRGFFDKNESVDSDISNDDTDYATEDEIETQTTPFSSTPALNANRKKFSNSCP